MEFIEQLKRGWRMTGMSIRWMWQHPGMFWFPVLRIGLFSSLTFAIYMLFVMVVLSPWGLEFMRSLLNEEQMRWYLWIGVMTIGLLTFYLFFVMMLLVSVAVIDYALAHFNDRTASVRSSLWLALKRLPKIFLWAGLFVLVQIVIAFIRGDEKKSSFLRRLLGDALALAWAAATFFVTPMIAEDPKPMIATIKESGQLMKQHFGNVLGVAVAFGFLASLFFPGIPIIIATGMKQFHLEANRAAQVTLITTGLVTIMLRTFVTTARDVFKAAAYNYAKGRATGPFSEHLIRENFESK